MKEQSRSLEQQIEIVLALDWNAVFEDVDLDVGDIPLLPLGSSPTAT